MSSTMEERLAEGVLLSPAAPEYGVDEETKALLDADLDQARVKQVRGNDYIATHDAIRVANRIFGYGRWGHEVVELECVGSEAMKNGKGEEGWYTGYRCTVRLTVAGCVPVCGIGYGDAFEKQWSGRVTTHELAVKEAESDALKRALKNFGDQFGLILYAKADEKKRIAAEKAEEEYNAPAEQSLVDELRNIATTLNNEAISKALLDEIAEHGHARAGWIAKALPKARQLAAGGEKPAPAASQPVSGEDTAQTGNQPSESQNQPQSEDQQGAPGTGQAEGHAAAQQQAVGKPLAEDDREASEPEIDAFFQLAKRLGPPGMKKANDDVSAQRREHGGKVSANWLRVQCEQIGEVLNRAAAQIAGTVPVPVTPEQADGLKEGFSS